MGRHTTALVQRGSPVAPKTVKQTRFATRSAQHQKPQYLAKPSVPRSPGLRSRLYSTNTSRFLQARNHLATIREEPDEEDSDEHHRGADTHERRTPLQWTRAEGPSRAQAADEDADMSGWDDESTLVAMLQDRQGSCAASPEEDENDQLLELVQKLKAPMAAQSAALKKYLADTVLPAYMHVKGVHQNLEDKVDLEFGAGLLTFDEVCKKVERIALKDEDEIRTVHTQSQRTIAKTLAEIEQAYEQRRQLWTAFQDEFNQCASRATAVLDALPTDVEQTIALLEKKCKALEKDTGAASNQKLLRGLLEKL
ncbi:hypothetical protein C8Q79DRAFT_907113 [Trametes meyenii]|nr:hypothetical protein C8Q79DRAFT_907113 [Trametes meyenii]